MGTSIISDRRFRYPGENGFTVDLKVFEAELQKQIDELKQCLNSVVKGDSSQDKQ